MAEQLVGAVDEVDLHAGSGIGAPAHRKVRKVGTPWPRACSTTRVEPTGTVDLLMTTVSGSRWGPISVAASRM